MVVSSFTILLRTVLTTRSILAVVAILLLQNIIARTQATTQTSKPVQHRELAQVRAEDHRERHSDSWVATRARTGLQYRSTRGTETV